MPIATSPAWKLPFSRGELAAILAAMGKEAGLPGARVELVILHDCDMERLHGQSLGRKGPTNVLSFPLNARAAEPGGACRAGKPRAPKTPDRDAAAPEDGFALGSLALSADTLARECLLYGQEAGSHCIRLLAHGFAHLLGLDHGPEMERLCARLEETALSVLQEKTEVCGDSPEISSCQGA